MKLTRVLFLVIFLSMLGYAYAETDEDDELLELLTDITFFIAGALWRTCMDNDKCATVAIPTVLVIGLLVLVFTLVHRCVYGSKYDDDDYEYSRPKLRRGFAFGAGYLAGI